VEEGFIKMLEGYTYEEKWPEKITMYNLKYIYGEKRDLGNFRSEWK
jgi:hypothetical protein